MDICHVVLFYFSYNKTKTLSGSQTKMHAAYQIQSVSGTYGLSV